MYSFLAFAVSFLLLLWRWCLHYKVLFSLVLQRRQRLNLAPNKASKTNEMSVLPQIIINVVHTQEEEPKVLYGGVAVAAAK